MLTAGWLEPAQQPLGPEHEKVNKKLVRQIRVDTHDGTTMVKFLIDVVEGNEPDARVSRQDRGGKGAIASLLRQPCAARP